MRDREVALRQREVHVQHVFQQERDLRNCTSGGSVCHNVESSVRQAKVCERRWLALSDRAIALHRSLVPDEFLRSHIARVRVNCKCTVKPARRSSAR